MRNIYLIIFLCLIVRANGQELQNATWYFGNQAGLKFTAPAFSPTGVAGSVMNSLESGASVSDDEGNLLFYTNGITVWDKNNNVMLNGTGLKSDVSITQGVIIVRKPGNEYIYYIVTIDGFSGNKKGLYYSEVNMQLNGGLGAVTSIKNIPLKNDLGVNLDAAVYNLSEKLTSTKHANGYDYWVVTQVSNKVHSYLVTSSGFNVNPAYTSIVSVNTDYTDSNGHAPALGGIKISPEGDKIGICYYFFGINTSVPTGSLSVGTFNNMTGQVSINQVIWNQVGNHHYGLEFSPSGEYIYYTDQSGTLKRVNLSNNVISIVYSGLREPYGVQLGLDNKIYLSCKTGSYYVSVVNNPDAVNLADVDFDFETIYLGGGRSEANFPQWVHSHPKCYTDLVLVSTINNVISGQNHLRQASNSITASNVIYDGGKVEYHAGNYISLKPGFHSKNGSDSWLYIEGCTMDPNRGLLKSMSDKTISDELDIEVVKLSPNPANTFVTIQSQEVMNTLTVTSIEGMVMYRGNPLQNSFDLNVLNFKKGIYVVTVESQKGEIITKKLIKE